MPQMTEVRGVATSITVRTMTCVRYHKTDVVLFDDQSITLRSGGWDTVMSRTRMNQASNQFKLGFRVFRKQGATYVEFNGKVVPFADGMLLVR